MKAVLISINPLWCELIGNGEKTVEVRKNRPKLKTPFKVFIYCTKAKTDGEYLWTAKSLSARWQTLQTAKLSVSLYAIKSQRNCQVQDIKNC